MSRNALGGLRGWFSALCLPNRPRDQDCTSQTIYVGIGVDIDSVVFGHLASGMENFLVYCRKSAPREILGVSAGWRGRYLDNQARRPAQIGFVMLIWSQFNIPKLFQRFGWRLGH